MSDSITNSADIVGEDWDLDEKPKPRTLSPEEIEAEQAEIERLMRGIDEQSRAFNAKATAVLEPEEPSDPLKPRLLSPPQLLAIEIIPRDPLLVVRGSGEFALCERDYGMIFAARGTGKTQWALGEGLAIAGGGVHANYRAVAPRRVLYVEGEMPLVDMKARVASFLLGMPAEVRKEAEANFRLLSWERNEDGIPSLAGGAGQEFVDRAIEQFDPALVYLDNISALAGSAAENDENEWDPIGSWAKGHRRDRAFSWVHHAGRNGQARGTSKREDPMDWVLHLRRPTGYKASQGAVFEAVYTKSRGKTGLAVDTRTYRLINNETEKGLICHWEEVVHSDVVSDAIQAKVEKLVPICEALLKLDPMMKTRELRSSAREHFKEEYGMGVSDAVITQALRACRFGGREEEDDE